MGGDFRRLHHQQQKTAGDAVITARRSDVVEGNVQRITQDRHQTSSALHGTRSRQDLLGDAARRSDQNTSSAAHSRQTKLRDATKMYESSQQHLASLNTSPVVSTTTLTPAPSAESVPTAQSQFRQSVTHGGIPPYPISRAETRRAPMILSGGLRSLTATGMGDIKKRLRCGQMRIHMLILMR